MMKCDSAICRQRGNILYFFVGLKVLFSLAIFLSVLSEVEWRLIQQGFLCVYLHSFTFSFYHCFGDWSNYIKARGRCSNEKHCGKIQFGHFSYFSFVIPLLFSRLCSLPGRERTTSSYLWRWQAAFTRHMLPLYVLLPSSPPLLFFQHHPGPYSSPLSPLPPLPPLLSPSPLPASLPLPPPLEFSLTFA